MAYEKREYRNFHKEEDLHHFQVVIDETDLDIGIKKEQFNKELVKKVEHFIFEQRKILKEYINNNDSFITALKPWNPEDNAPDLVLKMCEAGRLAGVGPMASVAGYFAEKTGQFLARYSKDVIVENGGDIWLKSSRIRKISIYAGTSPFSHNIGIEIRPENSPLGICTSSGTVGHSISFGRADAVVVLAPSAVLADAVATAACNMVQNSSELEQAVNWGITVPCVSGIVAVMGDKMAVRGELKLIPL